MTRKYELLFVLKPTLTDEELQAKHLLVKELLEKNGGEIFAFQNMGTRKLAYKVEKFERGYYGVYYFTITSSSILEIERVLNINEEVIKFMTVKYEKQKELQQWKSQVEKFGKKDEKKEEKVETKTEETKEA